MSVESKSRKRQTVTGAHTQIQTMTELLNQNRALLWDFPCLSEYVCPPEALTAGYIYCAKLSRHYEYIVVLCATLAFSKPDFKLQYSQIKHLDTVDSEAIHCFSQSENNILKENAF